MTKIVRTPTRSEGPLTDDERAAMAAITAEWTAIAMQTGRVDPAVIVPAVHRLYAAAGFAPPRVVIAPSPLAMAFAFGAAAEQWRRAGAAKWAATRAATRAATEAATWDATEAATWDATWDATRAATWAATGAATEAATWGATWDATRAATRAATGAATEAATWGATRAATRDATRAATEAATWDATRAATRDATEAATWDATWDATEAATWDATRAATRDATEAATWDATWGAADACRAIAGDAGIEFARHWPMHYQGGAYWAGFCAYAQAARDVLGLRGLDCWGKYQAWEDCARAAPFRVLHEKFCIVSDFPEALRVDDQRRPHCETGPSHRWRDGWSLYHWHGVRVPAEWIEARATLSPATVLRADDVEQRAAGVAIIGHRRMMDHPDMRARVIDGDPDTQAGALVEMTLPGLREPARYLIAVCPRNGHIAEGVAKVSDVDGAPISTALAAQAWKAGEPAEGFRLPTHRT